jgi:hypothetical protein
MTVNIATLLTQGEPSTDSSLASMNKFENDVYVCGNGSAPNNPTVAGFYLGRSYNDQNRHMDIVSGGNVSYIDFNKDSYEIDYSARLYFDVSNGATHWEWGTDNRISTKSFTIKGSFIADGPISSSYDSNGWFNSAAFNVPNGWHPEWMRGYSSDGLISISTRPQDNGHDNNLYFAFIDGDNYGNGTGDLPDSIMAWNGANHSLSLGTLTASGGFKYNTSDKCIDVIFT